MDDHARPPIPIGGATPPPSAAMLQALERIEAHLLHLNARLDVLETTVRSGEGIAAMLADTLDDRMATLQARGIDAEARVAQLTRIVEAATRPEILRQVELLVSRSEAISQTLSAVSELPHLLGTMADTVDTTIAGLQARGMDIDERLHAALHAADRLTSPSALRALDLLFGESARSEIASESDVPKSPLLRLLVDIAEVSVDTLNRGAPPMGLWAALRAAGEESPRRLLGLGVHIARGLGARLARYSTLPSVTR
jgi:hypothetical protein